jgi:hypothetical protein
MGEDRNQERYNIIQYHKRFSVGGCYGLTVEANISLYQTQPFGAWHAEVSFIEPHREDYFGKVIGDKKPKSRTIGVTLNGPGKSKAETKILSQIMILYAR